MTAAAAAGAAGAGGAGAAAGLSPAGLGIMALMMGAGAYSQHKAASEASKAAERGARQSIRYARQADAQVRADTAPYREAGYTALDALLGLTGLPSVGRTESSPIPGADQGLTVIPGATWQNRPVFTDGKGAIFSGRGKYWTADDGLTYLGHATEGGKLRFEGKSVKYKGGRLLGYQGGQFTAGVGRKASAIDLPAAAASEETEAAPGGALAPRPSPGDMVRADPGYQFRLDEGMRALERSRAASGGLLSGGTARAATRYAQDYASNEYQNLYNRIATIAGFGTFGTSQTNQSALMYGQQAGQAVSDAAFTRASAYTAQGNNMANLFGQGAQMFGYWAGNRNVPGGTDPYGRGRTTSGGSYSRGGGG